MTPPSVPVRALVMVLASLIASAAPLGDLLCYDRPSILRGELWRTFTGHWVHFSAAHLFWNGLAMAITGTLLEWRRERGVGVLFLLAPLGISALLLVFEPRLQRYGGLSGVVFAAVAYLALRGLREAGSWRWLCSAALALLLLKIGHELLWGESLLAGVAVRPVPASHAAGALCGAVAWAATLRRC